MLPRVFDAWKVVENQATAGMSFDVGDSDDQPAFVWRVDLPGSAAQAQAVLDQKDAQLQAASTALEAIPARIDHLVEKVQGQRESGVSFGLGEDSAFSREEIELLGMLESFQPGPGSELSFGLVDNLAGLGWQKAYDQFQAVFDQVQQMITHLALVETRVGGALVATTLVGWNGRTDTSLDVTVTPEIEGIHAHSLAQALNARIAMLKMITITVQSAVKVSALVTMPGGALLALPAVWNYARQMVEQFTQFQASHS